MKQRNNSDLLEYLVIISMGVFVFAVGEVTNDRWWQVAAAAGVLFIMGLFVYLAVMIKEVASKYLDKVEKETVKD